MRAPDVLAVKEQADKASWTIPGQSGRTCASSSASKKWGNSRKSAVITLIIKAGPGILFPNGKRIPRKRNFPSPSDSWKISCVILNQPRKARGAFFGPSFAYKDGKWHPNTSVTFTGDPTPCTNVMANIQPDGSVLLQTGGTTKMTDFKLFQNRPLPQNIKLVLPDKAVTSLVQRRTLTDYVPHRLANHDCFHRRRTGRRRLGRITKYSPPPRKRNIWAAPPRHCRKMRRNKAPTR